MGNILRWEGLISSARLQEMAVDGLLNRYLLLALQHSHLYYDSLEKAKAVITVILLQFSPGIVPLLLLLSPSYLFFFLSSYRNERKFEKTSTVVEKRTACICSSSFFAERSAQLNSYDVAITRRNMEFYVFQLENTARRRKGNQDKKIISI